MNIDQTIKDSISGGWVEHMPASIRPYLRLSRYDRPIGFWLLTLPGWIGLAFAALTAYDLHIFRSDSMFHQNPIGYWHEVKYAVLIAIGAIAMRGAGCTYNDIVDQDLDALVDRTALRPLPAGTVSTKQAWIWLAVQCLIGLVVLSFFPRLSQITALCSIALVAAYPFMKRITFWPQAWLGFTFNWAILVAFTASITYLSTAIVLLYLGLVFWTIGYDTIYACQDVEDDAMIGVKSTARLFGNRTKFGVGVCYTTAVLLIGYALFYMSTHIYVPNDNHVCGQVRENVTLSSVYGCSLFHIGSYGGVNYLPVRHIPKSLLLVIPFALHLLWQVWKLDQTNAKLCLSIFKSNRNAALLLILGLSLPSLANLL